MHRNGALWYAYPIAKNFGSGDVSAIRWVQIDVSNWPNSVSYIQDSIFGADGKWSFFPALMVNAADSVAMVFARSSASEFASMYYTGRLGTDPPNTLRSSVLIKAGTATLNIIDNRGRNRFGDYAGAALDLNDGSFWLFGEVFVHGVNSSSIAH